MVTPLLVIAGLLFVVGVIIMALSVNGRGAPWFPRAAWLIWMLAAIIWFLATFAGDFSSGYHFRIIRS